MCTSPGRWNARYQKSALAVAAPELIIVTSQNEQFR